LIQRIKEDHLDDDGTRIVVVSPRKTFTNHILNEFTNAGIHFKSYLDLDLAPIDLRELGKIIIQVESLPRIQKCNKIDLLVMDVRNVKTGPSLPERDTTLVLYCTEGNCKDITYNFTMKKEFWWKFPTCIVTFVLFLSDKTIES